MARILAARARSPGRSLRPAGSRASPPRARRSRTRAVAIGLLLLVVACAKPPAGPPFSPAPSPPAHRGRIYLYRVDDRSSASRVRIRIDEREIGTFRDREYETLELPAGSHHLRAGLRSLALVAWGWNEHRIRLKPGETAYIEISVRLAAHERPASRQIEIAGRPEGVASENVFLQRRPAEVALPLLRGTTRLTNAE